MEIGVLIVDDEEDIRFLIRAIIDAADEGLRVLGEARDGKEALEHIDELDPKVVVLDERMPGKTGIETAVDIGQKRPGQRIILCSAYLDDELVARAEEAGIKVCLSKQEVRLIPQTLRDLTPECAAN